MVHTRPAQINDDVSYHPNSLAPHHRSTCARELITHNIDWWQRLPSLRRKSSGIFIYCNKLFNFATIFHVARLHGLMLDARDNVASSIRKVLYPCDVRFQMKERFFSRNAPLLEKRCSTKARNIGCWRRIARFGSAKIYL